MIEKKHDDCVECATQMKGYLVVQKNVKQLMDQGIIQSNHIGLTKDVVVIEPHFELPTPLEIEFQRAPNMQKGGIIYLHQLGSNQLLSLTLVLMQYPGVIVQLLL